MILPTLTHRQRRSPQLPGGEDKLLEHGFCDFAFGSAQNDRVGGLLRNTMNFSFINFDYS